MANEPNILKFSVPFVYASLLLAVVAGLNGLTPDDQQYSRLAQAFLSAQLGLPPNQHGTWSDTAPLNGNYYSPLGPFPAVMIMPFIWLEQFHQGAIAFCGTLLVYYLCHLLARRFEYSNTDSCWFALAFCFGTSYIGVAALASSNHLAHILSVALLFLAICEYEHTRRLWLIGGAVGLALATRAPSGLTILFFILAIICADIPSNEKFKNFLTLMVPYSVIAMALAAYNYARFGTPLESGYSLQLNGFGTPYASWDVPGNTAGPAIALSNIPKHLFIFVFGLPSFRGIGTSVFLISPFFIELLRIRQWDLINKLILASITPVLLTVLAFRSTGFEQMGYRFSLDFLPFVFWLMIRSKVHVTGRFKAFIFLATVVDICLTFYHMGTVVDRRAG